MGDLTYADKDPKTSAFMADLRSICEKHGLCVVPVYDDNPSQHDPMFVVPFDESWKRFYEKRIYVEPPEEEE